MTNLGALQHFLMAQLLGYASNIVLGNDKYRSIYKGTPNPHQNSHLGRWDGIVYTITESDSIKDKETCSVHGLGKHKMTHIGHGFMYLSQRSPQYCKLYQTFGRHIFDNS